VFDWLYFEQERHGFDTSGVAAVYGDEDIRTGCVGCNLASRDNSLERLLRQEEWKHLRPLMELRPLYAELTKPRWRKRKLEPELRQDGQWSANPQRMGPLTMAGRAYGLERVLDIQRRAIVDLVSVEEEERIKELWRLDTWPNKWTASDIDASVPVDALRRTADGIATQTLLVR
jgi:DNA sulfur modification protein DndC